MSRPEVYDYKASITWVFDFMTINHVCAMEYEDIVDYDEAETRILIAGMQFINEFYGINLFNYKCNDVHIDWEEFPELKEE